MKPYLLPVFRIVLGSILIGAASGVSAQVLRNAPHMPDLDLSECPAKAEGRFKTEFPAPIAQPDGSYKNQIYFVSESVLVLMSESEFGFAKDYSDVSGYDHPDRFALSICAPDALDTIMAKRKSAANLAFAAQALDVQSQALEATQKELEEANARLAELEARKQPTRPAAPSTPGPLVPPPSSSSQTLYQALQERDAAAPALGRAQGGAGSAQQRPSSTANATIATALPATINQDLAKELDAIIARDSRSWLFNRYNQGSVHDIRVLGADAANTEVQGRYRFNGSSIGWIKVRFTEGKVNCLIYHDFPGNCRPVGQNPAGMIALGLVAGAAMSSVSGGSAPAGGSSPAPSSLCPRTLPSGETYLEPC